MVYQIYPRSFADGNSDGVGDLRGVRQHLDHLVWLGVDALWLSPIFPSPMADFGYDVSDYCDVDPIFGTLDDLDDLVQAAHERGIRVLLDWVPNHTSIEHPWFIESSSSRESPYRDWYVWRDSAPDGGPPNNWRRMWSTEPAWTFDSNTNQWFLHTYFPEQPDLDWHHPAVESAMHDTLRFWLDRGVDGFRADVVHLVGKDRELADLPPDRVRKPLSREIRSSYGHTLMRRIRSLLDSYPHEPMMVGEVWLFEPGETAAYLGDGDELHQVFDFRAIKSPWTATEFRSRIEEIHHEFGDRLVPTWVLGSHDYPRQRTRFGDDRSTRAAAVLTLTLRGSAYLFQGEELGLSDATVDPETQLDPAGRDGCRAPIPWTRESGHGWASPPWLPHVDRAGELSVEAQLADRRSILWLYHDLLSLRRQSRALLEGRESLLDTPDGIVGWCRASTEERVDIFVNFTGEEQSLDVVGSVSISSDPERTATEHSKPEFNGVLGPHEAIVIER